MQTLTTHESDPSTGPRTPAELMARFGAHVGRGELDALMNLYTPEAVFLPEPGVVLRGLPSIRAALGQMLALSPTMDTEVEEVIEAGDIALVLVSWTMRGTAPDGTPVQKGGRSADVLRREPDGTWRVLVDHP